jgi:phage shock protein A
VTQQISIEDALDAFRKRHGEVADENVLLRAQVSRLERELAEAQQENARLQQDAPNLAAAPPYGTDEQS